MKNNTLILFDRKHFFLIGLLSLIFTLSVLFKIHGFSISMWHSYIDGTKQEEVLIRKAQPIRSDDWAVEIPLMLSQLKHDPKFPMVNRNIGDGSNMLTHSKFPIYHFLTLFKPTVWGFFLGGDFGLSWMWQSTVIGMFYIFFLVLMIISKNDLFLSVSGSLFLIFSPFFQFWSFHVAEVPIFIGLSFISFSYICFSQNITIILSHSLILGWGLSCFAIHFVYPPFQISCGYLLLFMIFGFLFQRFTDLNIKKFLMYRIAGGFAAILIFAFVIFYYFYTAKDIIDIMMNTVYPGKRFCTGGDYSVAALFRHNFFSLFLFLTFKTDWGTFRNPCAAASFVFFFVPVIASIFWQFTYKNSTKDKFSFILIGYFLLMLTYLLLGFPKIASKLSLFYLMPSNRAIIGLGIANVLLLVSFLKYTRLLTKVERSVISGLWGCILLVSGIALSDEIIQISIIYIIAVSIISAFFSYFLLDIRLKKQTMVVLVGATIVSTIWFNPVVSGGTKFIYENQLSKKIIDIDTSLGGKSVWATFGEVFVSANLIRMLGVKSIDGTHHYPQLDLWHKYDLEKKYFNEYNRFAHVIFKGAKIQGMRFHSPVPDQLHVYFNPASKISDSFGITHYLVIGKEEIYFKNNKRFKKIFTLNDKSIYELNPV